MFMRKLTATTVVIVMMFVMAIPSFAYYNGEREPSNYTVPKINSDNPGIVFDGIVDLNGEWYGALHNDIDLTKEEGSKEITLWDPKIWNQELDSLITQEGGWKDLPDDLKCTWNYYYMWDDVGLYIAVTCDNDKSNPGPLDVNSLMGDSYDSNKFPDCQSFMITPYDNLDNGREAGWMYWYDVWANYLDKPFWIEEQTTTWDNFSNNPKNLDVKVASKRDAKPTTEGYYPYAIEMFIPWEGLKYDADGTTIKNVFTAKEGWTFMLGAIGENRTGDKTYYIRGTKAKDWLNYDYYKLGIAAPAVIVETTEVTDDVSGDNPVTSDANVIIYALSAISSLTGFLVLKKKK